MGLITTKRGQYISEECRTSCWRGQALLVDWGRGPKGGTDLDEPFSCPQGWGLGLIEGDVWPTGYSVLRCHHQVAGRASGKLGSHWLGCQCPWESCLWGLHSWRLYTTGFDVGSETGTCWQWLSSSTREKPWSQEAEAPFHLQCPPVPPNTVSTGRWDMFVGHNSSVTKQGMRVALQPVILKPVFFLGAE